VNVTVTESIQMAPARPRSETLRLYYVLFFFSGFPALLYQIVWQRTLFTLYGVNVQSVTIIVTVFMLGLGLGSLAGGKLSEWRTIPLLLVFGVIEISVGVFGAGSLQIFHHVASLTAGASTAATGAIAFALLLAPTLLMGSTLPLLVEYFVRRTGNVGSSVGSLYSVNTFGSGAACLCAAVFIMRVFGESGTVRLAASFNCVVGLSAIALHGRYGKAQRMSRAVEETAEHPTIPFGIGMLLAGSVGFIALAYEIVWYRLYAFVSGGAAPTFAKLLAFYLFGIAYGSLAVRDICQKMNNDLPRTLQIAARVVMLGSIAAFLLGPILARWVVHGPYEPTFAFVFIAAALLGAAFPLLSHAAIGPTAAAGRRLSLLYLSNIVGSALGSFLIGFVVLDHWSTQATSVMLLCLGLLIAATFALLSGRLDRVFLTGAFACAALCLCSGPLFSRMYERLLVKTGYRHDMQFRNLVENRSGVIAVDTYETVYGGGIYDGHFNTDPVQDTNGIFRAYAIPALHLRPQRVLMIGLSSGSWAQIVANTPEVEDFTIVEINPGYLPLIQERAGLRSLLQNPKVHIVIDDGRRWLVGHPDRRFDFIVMNTTYHWRANSSNLLSREFLSLLRSHLAPGGIAYYNTTWSKDVLATGASSFPYALRISNFVAVSDSPFTLDKDRWRSSLAQYQIDGHPVLKLPEQSRALDTIVHIADEKTMIESRADILRRCKGFRAVTDDNMGTEWRGER
jgi:spermidine synthase